MAIGNNFSTRAEQYFNHCPQSLFDAAHGYDDHLQVQMLAREAYGKMNPNSPIPPITVKSREARNHEASQRAIAEENQQAENRQHDRIVLTGDENCQLRQAIKTSQLARERQQMINNLRAKHH